MRLRASGDMKEENTNLDIKHEVELVNFAKAVLSTNKLEITEASKQLVEKIGVEGMLDAAAIIAFFNAINRVADATGIDLDNEVEASEYYQNLSEQFHVKDEG
jgi:alkylhydroperoxidase family enzyme